MNPSRYFSIRYWAHRFFGTRPAITGQYSYVASGEIQFSGACVRVREIVRDGAGEVGLSGLAGVTFVPGIYIELESYSVHIWEYYAQA